MNVVIATLYWYFEGFNRYIVLALLYHVIITRGRSTSVWPVSKYKQRDRNVFWSFRHPSCWYPMCSWMISPWGLHLQHSLDLPNLGQCCLWQFQKSLWMNCKRPLTILLSTGWGWGLNSVWFLFLMYLSNGLLAINSFNDKNVDDTIRAQSASKKRVARLDAIEKVGQR